MANILSDATKWIDFDSNTPPSYWNGTAYEFLTGYSSHAAAMTYTGTVAAGDVVSLLLVVNSVSSRGTSFRIKVNGTETVTNDLTATGSFDITSGPLSAGDTVEVGFSTFFGYDAYDLDCVVHPSGGGPTAFWTDLVGCVEQ